MIAQPVRNFFLTQILISTECLSEKEKKNSRLIFSRLILSRLSPIEKLSEH
jgi:hypothetical protein